MSTVQYLADTHILLWALNDDKRLQKRHRDILLSDASVLFSAASIWEISIKTSLGKLKAPASLTVFLEQAGFEALNITISHAEAVAKLPFYHSDPFDRLLIAQGQLEKVIIMTVDKKFADYDVKII